MAHNSIHAFMKLSHHNQMQDFWADTALVPWSREARYNSYMQSFLTITAHVPRGVRCDFLCFSPVLFAKEKNATGDIHFL